MGFGLGTDAAFDVPVAKCRLALRKLRVPFNPRRTLCRFGGSFIFREAPEVIFLDTEAASVLPLDEFLFVLLIQAPDLMSDASAYLFFTEQHLFLPGYSSMFDYYNQI